MGAFLAGLTWLNWQLAHSSLAGREFLIQWSAGRDLAYRAVSPYQRTIEVPAALSALPGLRQGVLRFNTPIFSLFLIFPLILIEDYELAYLIWLVVSELVVAGILATALALTDWRLTRVLRVILVVSLGLMFYTVLGWISGNLILLASLFLILAVFSLQSEKPELAGILFALTTIQAHILWLVYLFVIFWAVTSRRWSVLIWFVAGVGILSVLGAFIVPDWLLSYIRTLWRFEDSFILESIGQILRAQLPGFGRQLAWILSGLMGILLIVEWVQARRKGIRWFYWTICLTIVATVWVGVPVHPAMFFLLSLPLLLVLSVWVQRTGRIGHRVVGVSLLTFLVGSWGFAFQAGLPRGFNEPSAAHYFFLPLILGIGLYWTRWWAIRPQRLFIEELRSSEAQV